MTPASAFQQSLSDMKSSILFRRPSSTHHGPRSSYGDRSRPTTTLEPLSKPAIAHHGGDPVFRSQPPHHGEDLRAKIFRRTSAWRQRSPFRAILDVTHRTHDVVITFRRSASCRHDITCDGPSPFDDVARGHAAQRSRSCTSFDAHDPRSLRSHTLSLRRGRRG